MIPSTEEWVIRTRYLKFYERYTCGLIIIYIAGVKQLFMPVNHYC